MVIMNKTYKATRTWADNAWVTDYPFSPETIDKGEQRAEITTVGPWGMISGIRALAVEQTDENLDTSCFEPYQTTAIIHGMRSLINPRSMGYDMEGMVSVGGKRLRAFTSSKLFKVNGTLIDVAILYVCRPKEKE